MFKWTDPNTRKESKRHSCEPIENHWHWEWIEEKGEEHEPKARDLQAFKKHSNFPKCSDQTIQPLENQYKIVLYSYVTAKNKLSSILDMFNIPVTAT